MYVCVCVCMWYICVCMCIYTYADCVDIRVYMCVQCLHACVIILFTLEVESTQLNLSIKDTLGLLCCILVTEVSSIQR